MWIQVYNPLGNVWLSTLVAAIPVVVLLVPNASGKVKAHLPAVIALVAAICIATWAFTLPPGLALRASVLGPVTGFFPIGWIVLNVIFLYRLAVEKGSFELLQRTIGNVSPDRHIQPLLIAFSFGAFRFVFKHSITLACLVGVLVVLQTYVFTGMVIHR